MKRTRTAKKDEYGRPKKPSFISWIVALIILIGVVFIMGLISKHYLKEENKIFKPIPQLGYIEKYIPDIDLKGIDWERFKPSFSLASLSSKTDKTPTTQDSTNEEVADIKPIPVDDYIFTRGRAKNTLAFKASTELPRGTHYTLYFESKDGKETDKGCVVDVGGKTQCTFYEYKEYLPKGVVNIRFEVDSYDLQNPSLNLDKKIEGVVDEYGWEYALEVDTREHY